ncbi:hypothetical protein [Yoonia maritima]|uniref:hypothetical protein n=1 Tax=Yoonia maritima TaxID=1435347 RepID=UPI0019551245|nr:hypothetical protein [Yoonia maritima]
MTPPTERDLNLTTITPCVRDALSAVPGAKFRVGPPDSFGSGVATPVAIKIFGPDLDTLTRLSRDLADRLAAIDGFADLHRLVYETNSTFVARSTSRCTCMICNTPIR